LEQKQEEKQNPFSVSFISGQILGGGKICPLIPTVQNFICKTILHLV